MSASSADSIVPWGCARPPRRPPRVRGPGRAARAVRPRASSRPSRRVDPPALAHRHHGGEHLEARRMRAREVRPLARESQCRLDEPGPGKAAVRAARARRAPPARPERRTSRCRPRSGRAPCRTAPRADQLERRAAPRRGRARRRRSRGCSPRRRRQDDGVTAAEQPGHHRFGHAGRQRTPRRPRPRRCRPPRGSRCPRRRSRDGPLRRHRAASAECDKALLPYPRPQTRPPRSFRTARRGLRIRLEEVDMTLTKEAKQEIIGKHGRAEADTGSPRSRSRC